MKEYSAYIGIDTGGTGLRILNLNRENGIVIENLSPDMNMKSFTNDNELSKKIIEIISGKFREDNNILIGCSSAGDVKRDELKISFGPNTGIVGDITYPRRLSEEGYDVFLLNDMVAAHSGAVTFGLGQGREPRKVVLGTFSSGFNVSNGTDAEFGHQNSQTGGLMFCGCGGVNHLEPLVSGNGAAAMAINYFYMTQIREPNHPILELVRKDEQTMKKINDPDNLAELVWNIGSKHIYQAFRRYPKGQPQNDIRETQVEALAETFGRIKSAYKDSELLIAMGSQTKDWDVLFEPAIDEYKSNKGRYQLTSLPPLNIVQNKLEEICAKGALAYAIKHWKIENKR